MTRDLYDRLKRIRSSRSGDAQPCTPASPESGSGPGSRAPRSPHAARDVRGLSGWREVAPLVLVRETDERVAPPRFAAAGSFHSRLLGRTVDPHSLRFMDTETTGLSGGAGTTVFLVGAGVLHADVLRVRQVLLVDFPAEPDYLDHVARSLDGEVWVSYNGKAFDSRLLESRFLMNGIPPLNAEQLDLLYWSRRLWRSTLGSCGLGDIERDILGRGRVDDIPGAEIPDRYFRFLRDGDGEALAQVVEHHRLDIVSLAHLFFRLETVLESPLDETSIDCYRLGRWMLASDENTGVALLEKAVVSEARDEALRAALLLARHYRRGGETDAALRVLAGVLNEGSVEPLVEAAKIHEHDLRDPGTARSLIEDFLAATGRPDPALSHRLSRLQRKCAAYL